MDRKVINTLEKLKNLRIDLEFVSKQALILTSTRSMLNLIRETFSEAKSRLLIHYVIDELGINNKDIFPSRQKEFMQFCGMAFKNKNAVWKEFSENPISATKDLAQATLLYYLRYAVYTDPIKAYEKFCNEIVFLPQGVQIVLDWLRQEDFQAIFDLYTRFCNAYPDYPHLYLLIQNKPSKDMSYFIVEGEYLNEYEEQILRSHFRGKASFYKIVVDKNLIAKRLNELKKGNLEDLLEEKKGKVIGIFAGELIELADWLVKNGKRVKTLFMKEVVHEGIMRFVFFVKKMHNPDAILKEKDIRYFLKYLKDVHKVKILPYTKILKKANNIPVKIFCEHKAGKIAFELATIPVEELLDEKYLPLYYKYAPYYEMIYESYQNEDDCFELIPFWQYKPNTQEKLYILKENSLGYEHNLISFHLQDILTSCADDSILIIDGIHHQRLKKEIGI